jgi:hypothetical protein
VSTCHPDTAQHETLTFASLFVPYPAKWGPGTIFSILGVEIETQRNEAVCPKLQNPHVGEPDPRGLGVGACTFLPCATGGKEAQSSDLPQVTQPVHVSSGTKVEDPFPH